MTAIERVTAVLERARVAGGWIDDIVARRVLAELGIDEGAEPVDRAPTSPNLEHG
jgi:hypothetical protein